MILSILQIGMWLLSNGPELLNIFDEIVALLHGFPLAKHTEVKKDISAAIATGDKAQVSQMLSAVHANLSAASER